MSDQQAEPYSDDDPSLGEAGTHGEVSRQESEAGTLAPQGASASDSGDDGQGTPPDSGGAPAAAEEVILWSCDWMEDMWEKDVLSLIRGVISIDNAILHTGSGAESRWKHSPCRGRRCHFAGGSVELVQGVPASKVWYAHGPKGLL